MANIHGTDNSSDSISEALSAPEPESTSQETPPAEGETLSPLYKPSTLSKTFHGYMTDRFGEIRALGAVDPISRSTVKVGDLVLTVKDNAASKIGIGEDKILQTAIQAFTTRNGNNKKNPTLRVYIDLEAYTDASGISIAPRTMATPEEQEKENKRAEYRAKNFYAKLRRNLKNLQECSASWKETRRGRDYRYGGVNVIGAWDIDTEKKSITVEFTLSFAEYLLKQPLTLYPAALLQVDDRDPNTYSIGKMMYAHYAIDNNVIKGTEQILAIKTLLEHTNLPTLEETKANRNSWRDTIKEPFDRALEKLKRVGFLSDYHYCYPKSKGKMIPDEKVGETLDSYEKFISCYIYYEIEGYEPHEVRYRALIEKREAEAEERQKKQEARAQGKSKGKAGASKKQGSRAKKSTSDSSSDDGKKPPAKEA